MDPREVEQLKQYALFLERMVTQRDQEIEALKVTNAELIKCNTLNHQETLQRSNANIIALKKQLTSPDTNNDAQRNAHCCWLAAHQAEEAVVVKDEVNKSTGDNSSAVFANDKNTAVNTQVPISSHSVPLPVRVVGCSTDQLKELVMLHRDTSLTLRRIMQEIRDVAKKYYDDNGLIGNVIMLENGSSNREDGGDNNGQAMTKSASETNNSISPEPVYRLNGLNYSCVPSVAPSDNLIPTTITTPPPSMVTQAALSSTSSANAILYTLPQEGRVKNNSERYSNTSSTSALGSPSARKLLIDDINDNNSNNMQREKQQQQHASYVHLLPRRYDDGSSRSLSIEALPLSQQEQRQRLQPQPQQLEFIKSCHQIRSLSPSERQQEMQKKLTQQQQRRRWNLAKGQNQQHYYNSTGAAGAASFTRISSAPITLGVHELPTGTYRAVSARSISPAYSSVHSHQTTRSSSGLLSYAIHDKPFVVPLKKHQAFK